MALTDVNLYNELSLSPVGAHTVITGTNATVEITAPEGANVIMFQPTNSTGNDCRIVFDYNGNATSGFGFRYDTPMGAEIMYLTDNARLSVYLNTGITFDYQWFALVKGN